MQPLDDVIQKIKGVYALKMRADAARQVLLIHAQGFRYLKKDRYKSVEF